MAINKEQKVFFNGKKMTLGELIEAYELQNENERATEIILEKLEKKGRLRYIDDINAGDEDFKEALSDIELDAKIAEIEADADKHLQYEADKRREGQLTYEEVEVDFPTRKVALDFCNYARETLRIEAGIIEQESGVFTLVLKDVAEKDLNSIRTRKGIEDASNLIRKTSEEIAKGAVTTVNFAGEKVIVPVGKMALSATFGVVKGLAKTTSELGANIVTGVSTTIKDTSKDMRESEDILRAKRDLIDAKDMLFSKFKKTNKRGFRFK